MTGFVGYPSPTPIFPALPSQTWSVNKEPNFKTQASVAISGRPVLIARQAFARWVFTVRYGGEAWLRDQTMNITPQSPLGYTELEQLCGLYLQCLGPYGEFYYDDPDDDSRSNASIGTGDATTTSFLVYRTWGTGPFSPVYSEPVGGIHSIDALYFDGVLQSHLIYDIDPSDARKILFTSAPGSGVVITASFHYYYICRFSNDAEDFAQWAENLWEKKELRFESVKF